MNIRSVVNELNTEIKPKEEELKLLRSTLVNIQNMCLHEDATAAPVSWQTTHGSHQVFYTCKICDKEWVE